MALDPQVEKLLANIAQANLPALNELSPAAARKQMLDATAVLGEPQPVESVEDCSAPGPSGEIPLRIYRPAGEELPVVVYFHGGGWVIGSIDTHDGYCRALANAAKAIVVSVDYRLAPEHRFPAAAEDCFAATQWVNNQLDRLDGRVGSLTVAGDSAGGNLAAVVALMARDRGGADIARQILFYPITDHDFSTASYVDFASDYFLTRAAMIWFWDHYCPEDTDRDHPYLSPLRAENLAGLPKALVVTAAYDPLCDEGEAYAARLRKAGVDVTLARYDGMIHGFIRRFDAFDKAQECLRSTAAFINAAVSSHR